MEVINMVSALIFSLIILGTVLAALGAFLIKKGTTQFSFLKLWKSFDLWWGLLLYGLSLLIYLFVLRGENLSFVYPLASIAYLWTTLLSVRYLGEKMNKYKWLGLIGIIIGVTFIGIGS